MHSTVAVSGGTNLNIQKLHRPRVAVLGFVTAILLLAASLVGPPAAATAVEPVAAASSTSGLSEQDLLLVDGALFGVGPVAKQLGTSIEPVFSGDDLERVTAYARESREGLVASNPDAVERAVANIRSGSVNSVAKGFEQLGGAFNSYISETYTEEELNAAKEEYSSTPAVPMCGAVAACVAAVAFAVYAAAAVHNAAVITAAAAVLVSVYAWCGAWTGCGRSGQATGNDRVKQEKFLANATRVGQTLPA